MAVAYARTIPNVRVLPLYQVSMFAQPQPCDMIVLREGYNPIFVEVRTNSYGLNKPSTLALSALPDSGIVKQVWMHKDGEKGFVIREWDSLSASWLYKDSPYQQEGSCK